MTTNTKPATPLPWIALGVNLSGIKGKHYPLAIYGEQSQHMVASVRDDRDNATASDIQDADYLTHAANSYQKLVEALRELMRRADEYYGMGGDDAAPIERKAARALLRSLGEDA